MRFLVTRPLFQANKTRSRLEALGHTAIVEPMLAVIALGNKLPGGEYRGIIATSSNAANRVDETWTMGNRAKTPVLVTGEATRTAFQLIGFSNCTAVNGSALKLCDHIAGWMNNHHLTSEDKLLYPCAAEAAHNVTAILKEQNVSCTTWPVYTTKAAKRLSPIVIEELQKGVIDGVFLYSTKTAKTFASLLKQQAVSMETINTYVLSREIFDSLPEVMKNKCRHPDEPTETALLDLLNS